MKHNLKQLIEGAETLADILRDYEVYDSGDCEMLKDGRMPEGKDKFLGICFLLGLVEELQELRAKTGSQFVRIDTILGEASTAEEGSVECKQKEG